MMNCRTNDNPEAALAKRLAAPSRVYGGGARSKRKTDTKGSAASKREKNLLRRGGTGRHAFKSKQRHKRR